MSSALQTYEQIQWNIIKSLISMNDTSILSKSVSIEADDFLNDKYKELFIVISRAKSEYEGDLRTSVLFELIEDNKLHEFCNKKGVNLEIYGIDKIANLVYNDHPELMMSLNLNINTNQILPIDEFVKLN